MISFAVMKWYQLARKPLGLYNYLLINLQRVKYSSTSTKLLYCYLFSKLILCNNLTNHASKLQANCVTSPPPPLQPRKPVCAAAVTSKHQAFNYLLSTSGKEIYITSGLNANRSSWLVERVKTREKYPGHCIQIFFTDTKYTCIADF